MIAKKRVLIVDDEARMTLTQSCGNLAGLTSRQRAASRSDDHA